MADKRMFSQKITRSDAFLTMPTSARLLYYDLSMDADDDGFVDRPKSVMRLTGASEDDLSVLVAKAFVIPFENGICVIKHWRINNYIRGDRYKETNYLELKHQLSVKENGAYTLKIGSGIPTDNQVTTIREHRVDKVSIDKIRLDKNIEDKSSMSVDTDTKTPLINYSSILKYWNERSLLKEITAITDKRKSNLHARIKEHGVEAIFKMIDQVKNSSFLRGNNKQSWTANFDWCIRPNNFVKILEGNYLDASKKSETLSEQVDRKVNDLNTKLGIFNSKEPERYV